eukprot:7184804-Prymnesium_polylepis.1
MVETDSSSFYMPILARSLCLQRMRYFGIAAQGPGASSSEDLPKSVAWDCPNAGRIFPRDIFLNFDDRHRVDQYECVRRELWSGHPCKQMRRAQECREAFVDALTLGHAAGGV